MLEIEVKLSVRGRGARRAYEGTIEQLKKELKAQGGLRGTEAIYVFKNGKKIEVITANR